MGVGVFPETVARQLAAATSPLMYVLLQFENCRFNDVLTLGYMM